jgi:hypothetical protein
MAMLLKDLEPYGIIFIVVNITVDMVMLLRYFGPHGIML